MLDFGLLLYSRPPKNSKDPIDVAINKKNKSSKSVGYYTPVRLTRDKLLRADYEAQKFVQLNSTSSNVTKSDFIDAKGFEKTNPNYGNDGRDTSRIEKYVRETIIKMIYAEVDAHDYITVDQLFEKVYKKVKRNQSFKTLDPDYLQTKEGQKEQSRQQAYLKFINKFHKGIRKLVKDKCPIHIAHLISKKDRRWLKAKIPDGTYIITFKDIPFGSEGIYQESLHREKEIVNAKRRAKRKKKKNDVE